MQVLEAMKRRTNWQVMQLGTIQLDKREALQLFSCRGIEAENRETGGNYSVERMKAVGIQKGSGRSVNLGGKTRRVMSQAFTSKRSRNTLSAILERGTEHLWRRPGCSDVASWNK